MAKVSVMGRRQHPETNIYFVQPVGFLCLFTVTDTVKVTTMRLTYLSKKVVEVTVAVSSLVFNS